MGLHHHIYKSLRLSDVRSELVRLRRAERTRKMKKQTSKARTSFMKASFRFTRELLGKEQSRTLRCSMEEVEQHPQRNVDLGPCPRKVEVEPPAIALNSKDPS